MVKYVWAVGTRSGSEFAIQLTRAADPNTRLKVMTINLVRGMHLGDGNYQPTNLDDVVKLARDGSVTGIKVEEPTRDDWLIKILSAFPEARVMGTYRNVHDVVRSHSMLRDSWGLPAEEVVSLFIDRLALYEALARERELFIVPIGNRSLFSAMGFLDYLGLQTSLTYEAFVDAWPVVNDIASLRSLPQYAKETPTATLHDLAILPGVDERYEELAERLNGTALGAAQRCIGRAVVPSPKA